MKLIKLNLSLVPGVLALSFAFTCVEPTMRAADTALAGKAAVARMEAAQNEVANVRSNILLTLVELDKVRGETDPAHPQFQAFTNQLARMEILARAFGKRAEEMKQNGTAYFTNWEARTAAISNPDARQRAVERYSERKASYEAIIGFMQEARNNFMPFVEELTSIQTILTGQRDPKSIAQAKSLFMRANWHCLDVQRALMEIEAQFDKLAESFAKDE